MAAPARRSARIAARNGSSAPVSPSPLRHCESLSGRKTPRQEEAHAGAKRGWTGNNEDSKRESSRARTDTPPPPPFPPAAPLPSPAMTDIVILEDDDSDLEDSVPDGTVDGNEHEFKSCINVYGKNGLLTPVPITLKGPPPKVGDIVMGTNGERFKLTDDYFEAYALEPGCMAYQYYGERMEDCPGSSVTEDEGMEVPGGFSVNIYDTSSQSFDLLTPTPLVWDGPPPEKGSVIAVPGEARPYKVVGNAPAGVPCYRIDDRWGFSEMKNGCAYECDGKLVTEDEKNVLPIWQSV